MQWRCRRSGKDFSSEVQSHIELEADRLRAEGFSEGEAYAQARRTFGNVTRAEERFYESRRWLWLDGLWQDARYTLRQFRQSKAFTLTAVVALALGIGANTAIFTLLHAVMFKPLPVHRPEELRRLGQGENCCVMSGYQEGQEFALFSYDLYKTLRDSTPEISPMAAFQAAAFTVSVRRSGSGETANSFVAEFVSSNYFDLLGIKAAAGRLLRADGEKGDTPPVAVISHRVWENRYACDPGVIGSSFSIKGKSFTVVGVTPRTFYGETLRPDPPDFWLPLATEPLLNGTNNLFKRPDLFWLYVIGRVPPGAPLRALESKINVKARQWYLAQGGSGLSAQDRGNIDRQYIPLTSASGGVGLMSSAYRRGLLLLMSLSSLVLIIACANVANLLLARGTALRAKTSLRLALGASRSRIVRGALTNSVLLSLLGGSAGLLLAFAATRSILLLAFRGAHYVPISSTPSFPVLGFTFAVSFATGLIFGIAPAWAETHSNPADALRGASRSTPASTALPQKFLVVVQAALSLVLLTGAGLLAQSLRHLENQHFGFRTDGRLIVRVNPNFVGYTPERLAASYRQLGDRLSQIPGVISASMSLYAPMSGSNWNTRIFTEESGSAPQPDPASYTKIGLNYFETLGTRLLQGRTIDERDGPGSQKVAVVNQTFADRFFKNRNPLGRRFGVQISPSEHPLDYEIIGVVEDIKYQNAYKPAYPTFFLPLLQMDKSREEGLARTNFINNIELHVAGNAGSLEPRIRKAVEEADSNLSVVDVLSYKDQLSFQFNRERLLATLTELFGALALILASVGLYGVVALGVARRTAEIGVRIALGATREGVTRMILREALAQVAVGIALGLLLTAGATRLLQHQLFGISTYDPATLTGAVVVLAGCAILAALLPARRAAGIDPMRALRVE